MLKESERGKRFNELDKILKQIAKHTTDDGNMGSRLNSLEMAAGNPESKIADKVKNYQQELQQRRTNESKGDHINNSVVKEMKHPLKEIHEEESKFVKKQSSKTDQVKKEVKVFGHPIKHIDNEKG